MKLISPLTLVLGSGPVAAVLSSILRVERVERSADDTGWAWPHPDRKVNQSREAARLVIVAGSNAGASMWIRLHREARDCPIARRVGCLLYGMPPSVADDLVNRDVFGRIGVTSEVFGAWSGDLALMDDHRKLEEFLNVLDDLDTLPKTAWQREQQAASCLSLLTDAIRKRSMDNLTRCLAVACASDWDAMCFPNPEFGNAHAWANHIRCWLAAVTAGVTPNWEEGLSLFSPLLRIST